MELPFGSATLELGLNLAGVHYESHAAGHLQMDSWPSGTCVLGARSPMVSLGRRLLVLSLGR